MEIILFTQLFLVNISTVDPAAFLITILRLVGLAPLIISAHLIFSYGGEIEHKKKQICKATRKPPVDKK